MNRTLGIILCVVGLVVLIFGGLTYTTREKVLDVGPIHATRDEKHNLPFMPIAGALVLLGGVVLLIADKR